MCDSLPLAAHANLRCVAVPCLQVLKRAVHINKGTGQPATNSRSLAMVGETIVRATGRTSTDGQRKDDEDGTDDGMDGRTDGQRTDFLILILG